MVESGGVGDERRGKGEGAAAGGGGDGQGRRVGGEKRGREEQRDEKGNQMGGGDGKKEAGQSKVAEGAESGSVKEGDVVPSKKVKNVPAHRGAFKRHLRKHTLLFQREGGKVAKGFIVTCIQGQEARSITSCSKLFRKALSICMQEGSMGHGDWERNECRKGEPGGGGGEEDGAGTKLGGGEGEGSIRNGGKDWVDEGGGVDGDDVVTHQGTGGGGRDDELWVVDPGCNGVCCITFEGTYAPDPVRVLSVLWEMAAEQGGGKFADSFAKEHHACHRFLPMQVACRSVIPEIVDACRPLLVPVFGSSDAPSAQKITFSVICDIRSCHSLKRMQVIEAVAALVDATWHKVSISDPETVILIQVIRSACGIAVVRGAQKFKTSNSSSFHLLSHAASKQLEAREVAGQGGVS